MKVKITGYEDVIDIVSFEVIDDDAYKSVEFRVPSVFIPCIIGEFGDPYEMIDKVFDGYTLDVMAYDRERKLIPVE